MRKYLILAALLAAATVPCRADSLFTLIPGPNLSGPAGSRLTWELESFNTNTSLFLQITDFSPATFDLSQGSGDSSGFTFPAIPPSTLLGEIDPFYSLTWATDAITGYAFSGNFSITSEYCTDNLETNCGATFETLVGYSASVSQSAAQGPEPGTLVLLGLGLLGIWSNNKYRR